VKNAIHVVNVLFESELDGNASAGLELASMAAQIENARQARKVEKGPSAIGPCRSAIITTL
jgi:hypothetical protein